MAAKVSTPCSPAPLLVTRGDVQALKASIDSALSQAQKDADACPLLPAALKGEIALLRKDWEPFNTEEVPILGTGLPWEKACGFAKRVDSFYEKLVGATCKATPPPPAPDGGSLFSRPSPVGGISWGMLGIGAALTLATGYVLYSDAKYTKREHARRARYGR